MGFDIIVWNREILNFLSIPKTLNILRFLYLRSSLY